MLSSKTSQRSGVEMSLLLIFLLLGNRLFLLIDVDLDVSFKEGTLSEKQTADRNDTDSVMYYCYSQEDGYNCNWFGIRA